MGNTAAGHPSAEGLTNPEPSHWSILSEYRNLAGDSIWSCAGPSGLPFGGRVEGSIDMLGQWRRTGACFILRVEAIFAELPDAVGINLMER